MLNRLSEILVQEFDVSEETFDETRKLCLEQNAILSEMLVKKKVVTETPAPGCVQPALQNSVYAQDCH